MKKEEQVEEEMDHQAWLKKSEEILTDINEWRRAHPKATFVEIEEEVHKRMMQLEAQVLQDAAKVSPSREWGRGSGEPAPLCAKCGVSLEARGKQKRTLQGNGGEFVGYTTMREQCTSLLTSDRLYNPLQ